MSFKSLVYTDARRDESVHGQEGFQFQAISEGVGKADEDFAARLLYVVPHSLLMADVPVEDFPESFAYRSSPERYAVARGKYLGRVADGRPGNQVTHCLLTSDPDDLLPYRPAQLFATACWDLRKAASTALPTIHAPLAADPAFEVPALHQMVTESGLAQERLPVFLTMIEQAAAEPRTRLVLVHRDLHVVMRWIALGTLFLDRRSALALGFRAFSGRPLADAEFPVVGTCEEVMGGPLDPSGVDGVNVVDLATFECSAVAPSATARTHASWFADGEPFEALEAIEVSRRWASVTDSKVAIAAVEPVVLSGRQYQNATRPAAAVLAALTSQEWEDDLDEYGEDLVDAVHQFDRDDTASLDEVVGTVDTLQRHGHTELAAGCRMAALEMAALDPSAASRWAQLFVGATAEGSATASEWPDDDMRQHAIRLVVDMINGAPDRSLPDVFALARHLDTGVGAQALRNPVKRLAQIVARDPGLASRRTTWLHWPAVHDALLQVLGENLSGPGRAETIAQLRAGAWDWLAGKGWVFRRDAAISPWLAGRKVAMAPSDDKVRLMAEYALNCTPSAWQAFFDPNNRPDSQLIKVWLEAHRTVEPGLASLLERALTARVRGPQATVRVAELVDVLDEQRPIGLSAPTTDLLEESARFRRQCRDAVAQSKLVPNPALEELEPVSRRTLIIRQLDVANLVLRCHDTAAVARLIASHDVDLSAAIAYGVERTLKGDAYRGIREGLRVYSSSKYPDEVQRPVGAMIGDWWHDRANKETVRRVKDKLSKRDWNALNRLLKHAGRDGGFVRWYSDRKKGDFDG